jgi:hypothetical protein
LCNTGYHLKTLHLQELHLLASGTAESLNLHTSSSLAVLAFSPTEVAENKSPSLLLSTILGTGDPASAFPLFICQIRCIDYIHFLTELMVGIYWYANQNRSAKGNSITEKKNDTGMVKIIFIP